MFRRFWEIITAIASFIFQSFTHYNEVATDIITIVTEWRRIRENVRVEAQRLREFRFDPKWKTRVINVPIAVEQIQDLQQRIFLGWSDRINAIVEPFHELSLVLTTEAAPDPGDPQRAVSALARAQVKLGHIVVAIHQVAEAMQTVGNVVDLFDEVRSQIESFDALFLQQGNTRRVSREKASIRVGNLHS